MKMLSCRYVTGRIVGLIAVLICALTLWHLMLMLSTQSAKQINEDVPCCGRYFMSLLWNIFLLALFVLQHSGMSSNIWRRLLIRIGVDGLFHRPLYFICSCAILHLIIHHMSVLPGPLLWYFDVDEYQKLWLAVFVLHCLMWFVICAGAIAAEPMEFIGLRQLFGADVQSDMAQSTVHSRHVGLVAFLVILWVHMAMSVERFLLAMVWTLYALFGHRASPSAVYLVAETKNKQT